MAPDSVADNVRPNYQPPGPFHPHVMQPLGRADAAAQALYLKHILWAPGHGPLGFSPALLAAPSHPSSFAKTPHE